MRILLPLTFLWAGCPKHPTPHPSSEPRLVVVVVVDQLPIRQLERLAPHFTGGFRRLESEAAFRATARHVHAATFTCPGHATLSTGASPTKHGIVSNDWLVHGAPVYCADIALLRAEPLADVMKENGGSVVALSLKDRGAIMLGGHYADAVVYYDKKNLAFTAPFQTIQATTYVTSSWEPLLPEVYATFFPDEQPFESNPAGDGIVFPHPPLGEDLSAFLARPESGTALTDVAIASIDRWKLGSDSIPDLLAISYSEVDYIGHAFTSDSWEALDGVMRLDQDLGRLFAHLDATVGPEQYTILLSSDHGASPPATVRIGTTAIPDVANAALHAEGFSGEVFWEDPSIWLPESLLTDPIQRSRAANIVAEAVAKIPGIEQAFPWRERPISSEGTETAIRASVDEERSGDIYVIRKPLALFDYPGFEGLGTSHGTAWDYDQLVPLRAWGAGIHPQAVSEIVDTRAIAPTIAQLLKLRKPSDAEIPYFQPMLISDHATP